MELDNLPELSGSQNSKQRAGKGISSGSGGHTTGRGNKGQKARNKVSLYFEGGQLPLVRRLPHLPGFRKFKPTPSVVNVSQLNKFDDGEEVTPQDLVEKGFLPKVPKKGVKILGDGQLTKKINTKGFKYSETAKKKIEGAGGSAS